MAYRRSLGDFGPQTFPGFPGGLPGPVPGPGSPGIPIGAPVATVPAALFPTTLQWGDVVNVTGPFAGKFQGQVLVRFVGAPAQAIAMAGPYGGSVVVPDGAQTGACTVEVDGRTVFSANCVIREATTVGRPREHAAIESWKNVGTGRQLLGEDSMDSYVNDGTEWTRGVGAVAAKDGPGGAPAAAAKYRTKRVYPGVTVVRALGEVAVTTLQIGSGIGQAAVPLRTVELTPCGSRPPPAKPGYTVVCDTKRGKWRQAPQEPRAPREVEFVEDEFVEDLVPVPIAPPPKKKFPTLLVVGGAGAALVLFLMLRRR